MPTPILDQIHVIAMKVPDQTMVRVGDRPVVAVSLNEAGYVQFDLGEVIPPLEAVPVKPQKKEKEKPADGQRLD